MTQSHITLNNGVQMPMVGCGTFLLTPDEAEASVLSALQSGYRLVDTANSYVNEKAVGRAMKRSGVSNFNQAQIEEILSVCEVRPTIANRGPPLFPGNVAEGIPEGRTNGDSGLVSPGARRPDFAAGAGVHQAGGEIRQDHGPDHFEQFTIHVFNRCEDSEDIMIAINSWQNVHPMLKLIPVDWDYTVSFGLLHAPEPSDTVRRFLDAVKTVFE